MKSNRRLWFKQISLGVAGIGLSNFQSFASLTNDFFIFGPNNSPIKLSSNENPYGPSPFARIAMTDAVKNSNRYNWNTTEDLISALAKKNNVTDDNILVGAGSSEILDFVIQYFAFQKGSFIVANPSYTNWAKTAEKLGLIKISISLTKDKQHDLSAMLSAVDGDTKLIYLCNPNNPTGAVCENEALISFIREATKKVTVMIDEAYIDFTNQPSVCNLVTKNKNLIVVKTFSKIYGLAGARIGYAIAHKDTINNIGDNLQTWANGNVSVVSRAGAIASLTDNVFVKQCYAKNELARKYTIEQLTRLNITCIPSHTNFIYFSLINYKKDFFGLLKSNNIQGTYIYEEEGKWTRITVGTIQEMHKFISAIE